MSTICLHVKNMLEEISDYRKSMKKINKGKIDIEVEGMLNYLESNLKEVKLHGQAMEDRLKIYRDAIESCGFERKRDKSKRWNRSTK